MENETQENLAVLNEDVAKNIFSDNPIPASIQKAEAGTIEVAAPQTIPTVKEEEKVAPPVIETAPNTTVTVKDDELASYLKELGFDNPEAAKEQINNWRNAKPEVIKEIEPIKFANEESEKLFTLLKEGKTKEAAKIYQKQEEIENAANLNPLDQIRLQLKYKNGNYTNEDIEDIIDEKYNYPKKPVQSDDELDSEFKERLDNYEKESAKIDRRIKRDGQEAVEQLQQYKKELVLPDINNQAAAQENYLKQQKELEVQEEQARQSYKAALDKDYSNFKGFSSAYKNKDVDIQTEYKPTESQMKELKDSFDNGFDADSYFAQRWFNMKDDKVVGFNIKQQMEDKFLLEHKQEIFDKIAADVYNKAIDDFIKKEKRINFNDNSGVNDTTQNVQKTLDDTLTTALWKK